MKRLPCIFGAAVMAAAIGAPAMAQQSGNTIVEHRGNVTTEIQFEPAGTSDLNIQQLRDFQNVKQNDPVVAKELARKPSLIERGSFVRQHAALQAFLDKYPDARAEIEQNPGDYLTPVKGSTWNSHTVPGIAMDHGGSSSTR